MAASPKERKFISEGMSEGEVLDKIGEPDSESFDSGDGATETVKRWIYLPTEGDPQMVTTVVLKKGAVIEVTREVSREGGQSERKFICKGMSEGEVLSKIGNPDRESLDSGGGATETVKRWIYLPTEGDPQMVTTVVLKKGKVIEVTREVSR
jgi:ribosomal protein S8E